MEQDMVLVISIVFYKVASLVAGVCLSYMGYRLFMAGIWGDAGHAEAEYKDFSIILKRAAPGTFFVILGAIVLAVTLFMGLEYKGAGVISTTPESELPKYALPEKPPV